MKKVLESELVSIAHRILKLKGKEDVIKMHAEVAVLYEKLSVLKFAHDTYEDDAPTIGSDSSFFDMLDSAFNNKVSDTIEVEDKIYINLDEVEDDEIMEPAIETIKDMVAQMPQETQQVDTIFEEAIPKSRTKIEDLSDITSGFEDLPVFEPISKVGVVSNGKKSLNDQLQSGGLHIGLNDKIAFTKHLFNDSLEDYHRVISQLNTTVTLHDAKRFIKDIVKPDYNNWEGKEALEERFIELVERKFN